MAGGEEEGESRAYLREPKQMISLQRYRAAMPWGKKGSGGRGTKGARELAPAKIMEKEEIEASERERF